MIHNFRIKKYGIAIDFEAYIYSVNNKNLVSKSQDTGIKNLSIDYTNMGETILSDKEKVYIENAILWIFKLNQFEINKPSTLEIKKIRVFYLTYLSESLFFAVAEWVSLYLNLRIPSYSIVDFDISNKKIVFSPHLDDLLELD